MLKGEAYINQFEPSYQVLRPAAQQYREGYGLRVSSARLLLLPYLLENMGSEIFEWIRKYGFLVMDQVIISGPIPGVNECSLSDQAIPHHFDGPNPVLKFPWVVSCLSLNRNAPYKDPTQFEPTEEFVSSFHDVLGTHPKERPHHEVGKWANDYGLMPDYQRPQFLSAQRAAFEGSVHGYAHDWATHPRSAVLFFSSLQPEGLNSSHGRFQTPVDHYESHESRLRLHALREEHFSR